MATASPLSPTWPSRRKFRSDRKWRVTEIAKCPICLEDLKNYKSLPCVHSFCLQCLQDLCKDRPPRDTVPCPVCRKEFEIPDKGLDELPHNFFVQNLIDAKKASSEQPRDVLCESCEQQRGASIPPATKYCLECRQKLCTRCSNVHTTMTGGPHQVKELGAELRVELIWQRGSYCDQHPDQLLSLYCFKCTKNICVVCCIVGHPQPQHSCKEIKNVAVEFASKMDRHVKSISGRVGKFHAEMKQTDDETQRFGSVVDGIETSFRQRGEAMKRLIDNHVDTLAAHLQAVQQANKKVVAARKDQLELGVLAMDSFSAYSLELLSKGSPCDITRAANELRLRAAELLQTYVGYGVYCAPSVSFVPVDSGEFTRDESNSIGNILISSRKESTVTGGAKGTKQLPDIIISPPINFRHISHVGWNAETGFDVGGNPDLRDLLQQVGVTEAKLKNDKDSSKFAKDFLDERGDQDAVKREPRQRTPPPLPLTPPPTSPRNRHQPSRFNTQL